MEDNFEKFYNASLRYLSFRPRSEKEIRDYLAKKKAESSVNEKIVSKLKVHKFLNDEDFAKWWIEQRTILKPRAWKVIQYELKQKGISEEIVESQISNLQFQKPNDLESANKLIQRKILRYRHLPKQEIYQKLGRFLASKGFDWNTIKKSIDEALGEKV